MATSQAASSGTAAAVGGTANTIRETIVGSHEMEIKVFSGTKVLGVGKSIKSSTFNVGGHEWYIECYPCGDDEESAGCVSLFLCLSAPKEQVEAQCDFYALVDDHDDDCLGWYKHTYNAETSWRMGIDNPRKRVELESFLKDDCLQLGCVVRIASEFRAVPPPDLHRPLSDLLASGTFQVGGDVITLHRGLRGSSTHKAASATLAAGASTALTMSAENVAGSHVLTIEGYSQAKKVIRTVESIDSEYFHVGGHRWFLELYPGGEKVEDTHCLPIFLVKGYGREETVKVRFELTLLSLARDVISWTPFCYAFTKTNRRCRCYLPLNMEPEFSLLQDSFHVKCDVTIVNEITPLQPSDLQWHFGDLLASQVGTDVTFEVGSELFPAHKLVLATPSTAFMAEFFGQGGNGSSTTVTRVHINGMEPRVFKALLHFIYTDTIPVVRDDDKIGMAQGLLVAADRYAMERLKLICADMLCNYVNTASTAVDILELAVKHGCHRLQEKCMKLLKGHFAKVAP